MQDILERKLPLETSLRNLELGEKAEIEDLFTEQFQEILDRWPDLKVNYNYGVTFNRPHPDYSYDKELMNLYFRERYSRDGLVENIEPGYYTTSSVTEWELDRLEIIGQVIGRFRSVKPILLQRLTEIRTAYGPLRSEIYKQIWALEAEESEQKKAIHARKLADGYDYLLAEGLTFPEVHVDCLGKWKSAYFVVKATATKPNKQARTYEVTLTGKDGNEWTFDRIKQSALEQLIQMSNEFQAE